MEEWLRALALTYGYPGVFLLSFLGASSIIIPIPYTVVLLALSTLRVFDSFLLVVAAGLGSAVGEIVGYGLGYAGRRVVPRKYEGRLNAMLKLFNRFGAVAVFFFALTPLPDDLLFIPLGMLHYSFWRVFIPAVAGKFLMCFIIVYVGDVFGQTFEAGSIVGLITAIMLVLVVIAMFRIDWEGVVEKYLPEKER